MNILNQVFNFNSEMKWVKYPNSEILRDAKENCKYSEKGAQNGSTSQNRNISTKIRKTFLINKWLI